MIDNYLTYIIFAIIATAIPGPAVILTIRNSIKYGYKSSIVNIFGNFIAMVILATISAFGLGAIILTSQTLFLIMKILGCFYLVYLGIKVWTSPIKKDLEDKSSSYELTSIFKEGFIIGISNPKAIAFFVALFPQFIDPSRAYFSQFVTLILTVEGVSFMVLFTYALLAFNLTKYLTNEKIAKQFNKLTGGIFISFGVALLYKD